MKIKSTSYKRAALASPSLTCVCERLEPPEAGQAFDVNRGHVNCKAVAAAAVLFFTNVVHLFCC